MKTILLKEKYPAKALEVLTHYEVVEHNGKKFRIYIEGNNGYILGFNSRCALSIMAENGTWEHVVDNQELGFEFKHEDLYYGDDNIKKNYLVKEYVKQFKNYIEAVY